MSIPTLAFFWTAPLLGAALYVYLHLHLMTLWHTLAKAPAEIDGKPLGERAFPWLVNDLALSARRDKPLRIQPLRWLANLVTIALVWVAGPLVLLGFWLRSMPAHEFGMTLLISACLLVSLFVGMTGWWTFRQVIPLEREHARPWRGWIRIPLAGLIAVGVLFYGAAWSQFGFPTDPRVNAAIDMVETWTGPWFEDEAASDGSIMWSAPDVQIAWLETWITRLGADLSSANLTEVDLVPKPDDWRSRVVARRRFRAEWCKRQGIPADVCGETGVKHDIDIDSLNARRTAWCSTAPHITQTSADENANKGLTCAGFFARQNERFLEEWGEERQGQLDALPPLDLTGRDLRNAWAINAFLSNGDLRGANLEGADLRLARLEGANLLSSLLIGVDFGFAHLRSSNLRYAQLNNAGLHYAYLEDANLQFADLNGAFLHGARLKSAILDAAHLENADFQRAALHNADLRSSYLKAANLQNTILLHTLVHDADFTGVHHLTQNQLNTVLGNDATKLPADAHTGRPLHVWSCWAEPPPHFDDLVARLSFGDQERADALRAALHCPPGTEPECRGTYVSVDGVVGERGSSCPNRSR